MVPEGADLASPMQNEPGRELPVLQAPTTGAPRAYVFAGTAGQRELTFAEAKKARFIFNLRQNFNRLNEHIGAVEHFAVVCQLSEDTVLAIRSSKDRVIADLEIQLEAKIKEYDARISVEGS